MCYYAYAMEMKNGIMPAYLKIEDDLRRKIKSGNYKAGDRLSEKELGRMYGVSRLTVRKATSILSAEGYLTHVQGKGTFVNAPGQRDKFQDGGLMFKKLNKGIAVLIPCVTGHLYPGIIRGVEDVCARDGYHLTLGNYDAVPEKEKNYMEMFASRGISGMVIAPSDNSHLNPYYKILKSGGIPFVLVDISVKGVNSDLVATDNFNGAYIGTMSLVRSGCRNILFVCTSLNASSTRERLHGYKFALEESKIPFKKSMVKETREELSREVFAENAAEVFLAQNDKRCGIFSANEPMLCGVLKAAKKRAGRNSRHIGIVSFDKPEVPMELAYPVTFISQPRYSIGEIACELLLEKIKQKKMKKKGTLCKKILLEPELIEAGKE